MAPPPTVSLSSESWENIFTRLGTRKISTGSTSKVREILALRLVCKTFDAIHTRHLRKLSIDEDLTSSTLPGLLLWLRRTGSCLQVLEARCDGPASTAVFATLACLHAPLESITLHIEDASSRCALRLMSAFSAVSYCCLSTERNSRASVAPLQLLPHLKSAKKR